MEILHYLHEFQRHRFNIKVLSNKLDCSETCGSWIQMPSQFEEVSFFREYPTDMHKSDHKTMCLFSPVSLSVIADNQ